MFLCCVCVCVFVVCVCVFVCLCLYIYCVRFLSVTLFLSLSSLSLSHAMSLSFASLFLSLCRTRALLGLQRICSGLMEDPRFGDRTHRGKVADLFLPFLPIATKHSDLINSLPTKSEEKRGWTFCLFYVLKYASRDGKISSLSLVFVWVA